MLPAIRRILASKRFLIPVAVLLFYTITGFLIAPLAIRWYVPKYTRDQLKCESSIGKVSINPFLLRFEVNDFSLKDQDGSPLAGFARFLADFEMSSLFHWAAIFQELRIEKPMLNLVIEPDGALNFSRLTQKSTEQKAEAHETSKSKPVRLILRSMELTGGEVTVTDRRQSNPAVLNFQDLNLDLRSLSTLLGQNGTYSLVATTRNGESIEWQGDIALVPFQSRGKVIFSGIKAATLWGFLQNSVNLDSPLGSLSIGTEYRVGTGDSPLQVALENTEIDISEVALKLAGTDEPFFELGKFELDSALVDLAARVIHANKLLVDGGRLELRIDEAGISNLEKLVRRAPVDAPPPPQGSPSPPAENPWKVSVDAIEVKDIALGLEDLSKASPLSAGVESVSLSTSASIETGPSLSASVKDIAAELKGVHLGANGAPRPFFEAQKLTLEGGDVDLAAHTLSIGRIALGDGHLDVGINQDGKLNFEQLITPRAGLAAHSKPKVAPSAGDVPSPADAPWKVSVDAIDVKDIAFGLDDLSKSAPLSVGVGSISISSKASVETGPKPGVSVREIAAELKGVHFGAKGAPKPLFEAQKLTLEGGDVDLAARSISIGRIALGDGHLDVGINQDGKLNFEQLITPRAGLASASEAEPVAAQEHPWKFLLKTFELSNFRSALSDYKVLPDKELYGLRNIGVRISDVDGKSPMNFEVGFAVEQGGTAALSGKVDPSSQSLEARVNVAGLVLSPLQPYLEPLITLTLQSAAVSTQGVLRYGLPKAESKIAYEGSFGVDKLSLNQPNSKETYLGWESLQIPQLKLAMEPNRLQIPEIRLSKPTGELIIAEDRTVNLAKVVKDQPGKSEPPSLPQPSKAPLKRPAKASAPAPALQQKQSDGPFPFTIGKVRISDGNVLFADFSLQPKFMARIHQLNGTVSKLSLEKNALSEIRLDGRVDQYGIAKVSGILDLNDFKRSSDVNVVFRNVEMASISPYSGKFAGRRIKSGKLSMDLKYRIQDNKLVGDNKIVVDNLTLGEHVDSPDAVNLPLDLAIALLSDSNGRIDLGLPVSGDLKDPQFEVWPLIWKTLGNIITKAVTAPFRALGSLIGGGTEKFDAVEFEPGKAVLLPPEKEKLKKLSDALQKKTQLKVVIQGRYSPEMDGMELRELNVRRMVATRMGAKINPDEDPGPLDLDDSSTRSALEKIFVERFGAAALDELDRAVKEGKIQPRSVQDQSEQKEKKAKKRGIFSRVLHSVKLYKVVPGMKSPEQVQTLAAEWYARLVESETIQEDTLVQLAANRSLAVGEELRNANGVSEDRIATHDPEPLADEPGLSVGLSLDAMPASP